MINNSEIYFELRSSLKKERDYLESDKREHFLDDILSKLDYADIYYIYSTKGLNTVKFLKKHAIVIWDYHYWECFEEYLIQVENCKNSNKNITRGTICVITNFLSEKYIKIPQISAFLEQVNVEFGEHVTLCSDQYIEINNRLDICKCFALFHELGHLEYRKNNNDRISACKEIILTLLDSLKKEDFESLEYWMDLSWETVVEIKSGKLDSVLEEMIVDVFGIMLTVDYFMSLYKTEKLKLAYSIVGAIEFLTTFQNLFNIVTKAWDSHYAEMKFGLTPKIKKADSYVNKLEVARNGLGNLILVLVVYKMLNLEKDEVTRLWEYRDSNHINTETVIEYLADDEFICTAIQEEMS